MGKSASPNRGSVMEIVTVPMNRMNWDVNHTPVRMASFDVIVESVSLLNGNATTRMTVEIEVMSWDA